MDATPSALLRLASRAWRPGAFVAVESSAILAYVVVTLCLGPRALIWRVFFLLPAQLAQ